MRDLLRNVDDRFVVFGSGEGVKLEFELAVPEGWVLDSFYANGFLPYHYPPESEYPSDDEHLNCQLDYNPRQHSGRLPPSLRHHFY